VKELPILERKLYDSAMKLLIDEIAFSLDIPVAEVESIVHERLEPLGKIAVGAEPDAEEDDIEPEPEEEEEEDE
jgi:CarD family transcriptional regulator